MFIIGIVALLFHSFIFQGNCAEAEVTLRLREYVSVDDFFHVGASSLHEQVYACAIKLETFVETLQVECL